VSGFHNTGIYTLNPNVFRKVDLISTEVCTAVIATTEVDAADSSRGVDSSGGGVHFWMAVVENVKAKTTV
jgi:hypothetical protein